MGLDAAGFRGPVVEAGQLMQHHRHGVGEIQRGIGLPALQAENPLAEPQLTVAEAAVFPSKHQGHGGA